MHRLINTSACQRAETEVKSQCRFMSFQTGKTNIIQLLNSPCDLQPPEVSRRPLTFSLGPAATPLRRVAACGRAIAVAREVGHGGTISG